MNKPSLHTLEPPAFVLFIIVSILMSFYDRQFSPLAAILCTCLAFILGMWFQQKLSNKRRRSVNDVYPVNKKE